MSCLISAAVAVLVSALPMTTHAALKTADLRCEYLFNPLGIDETAPRLSWRVESTERGQKQTAFRVIVASSEALARKGSGDLWDSGKISSSQTTGLAYAGKPLISRQLCYWRVKTWDKQGRESGWSPIATWSMGLLKPSDWSAAYISFRDMTPVFKDKQKLFLPPARQYRKEFAAAKPVRRATIYSTALGIYEMHLNGRRVGEDYFAPGWTDYHQRAYYRAYDVTQLLQRGDNAWGAWVADGWYSGYIGFGLLTGIGTEAIGRYTYGKTPAFLGQLEIEYVDGSRETIETDSSWKVTGNGPVQEADFLMGEFYDARKEMPGWSKPGFDDRSWEPAILAHENGPAKATFYEWRNPEGQEKMAIKGREVDLGFQRPPRLEAYPGQPVRITQEIPALAITSPSNGVYIFNLGQNFAGNIRLKIKGAAGTMVTIRYGEMLHPDGRLMTENLRKARAIDHYVLRGDPRGETYVPRFTFHGFQYVELTGLPGKPGLDAVTGLVLHSDTPMASDFQCSDPVVNRVFRNVVWTQRANFLELPTDCPQRDERFGWTGDAQIYVRAATYNADVAAFYTKWLRELMESQRPSGTFPGFAPHPFQHGWDFGTAWADAGVICPWTIYMAYNDTRVIERCWQPMTRFMEWRKRTSKDNLGVVHGNDWGDWLSMGEKTPLDYIDTVYFAYSARLMAEMAAAIGKTDAAADYRRLAADVTGAFNRKYVQPDGSITVDTQTAYVLALFMDLVPSELRLKAGQRLADKIRAKASSDNSGITTGFLGTRPLLPVLSSVGQHDLAVSLVQSRKYPSWGYEVEQGATTIWERWNSYTKDNGFGGEQNASMNSFAHYSFGAVCEWMFHQLAGLEWDGPGWNRMIIRPTPPTPNDTANPKPIDFVKAHYDSMHGRIATEWKRTGDKFALTVRIPANTSATLLLPASAADSVRESGKPVGERPGVRFLRMESGRAVFALESGEYKFTSRL